jgi:hypothetical protein
MTTCMWCGKPFALRRSGGTEQRFCAPGCRRAFHAKLRGWSERMFAAGAITLDDLKTDAPTARALAVRQGTGEDDPPASGEPAGSAAALAEVKKLLNDLVDEVMSEVGRVPDQLWDALWIVTDFISDRDQEAVVAPMPNGNDTEDPAEPALDQAAE